jgi:hypothetical protein
MVEMTVLAVAVPVTNGDDGVTSQTNGAVVTTAQMAEVMTRGDDGGALSQTSCVVVMTVLVAVPVTNGDDGVTS